MCAALIDATVRLTRGEPTLWLERGELGVIRSVWHLPNVYYEVEIRKSGEAFAMRALMCADQIEVIAPPPPPPPPPPPRAFAETHVNGKGRQP